MELPSLCRYRFDFRADVDLMLPVFTGSTWRGAFGHALKKACCVQRAPGDCDACPLRAHCCYTTVFAPQAPAGAPKQYQTPSPMYVFAPQSGGNVAAGDEVRIELRLLGEARRHFPIVMHALTLAACRGIGARRLPLQFVQAMIWQNGWQPLQAHADTSMEAPPSPAPRHIRLRLDTPLRLKSAGRNLTPDAMDATTLLMSLLRRIYLIHLGDGKLPDIDWRAWQQRCQAVTISHADTHWKETPRKSARQGKMQAGGIIGSLELSGELAPFWPMLWHGQWLHLGHLACMGLGSYRLEAV